MNVARELLGEMKAIRQELAGIRKALEKASDYPAPLITWHPATTSGTSVSAGMPWTNITYTNGGGSSI
jgi:hypothetical protein